MADLLSGLSSMGLGNLADMDVFEKPKAPTAAGGPGEAKKPIVVEEKDIILDKSFECPVCDAKITSKAMKTGKAKTLRQDMDLRTVFEGIDVNKYDVIVCPWCGYAALTRFHKPMSTGTAKLIKDNISPTFKWDIAPQEIVPYEEAFKRYQLALVNAVVRRAKNSEKAFICLKTAWLMRGWNESLDETDENKAMKAQIKDQENSYLGKAYEGFTAAVASEGFPMCGMDGTTVDYLMAVLAFETKHYDVSSKLVAKLLQSPGTSPKTKDKLRDLKDMLLEALKNNKQ